MDDFFYGDLDELNRQINDIRRMIETWQDVDAYDAGSYTLINGDAGCVRVDHVDRDPYYSVPDISELLTE